MAKKTLNDVDVAGKRVLVRVDFNVPISKEGEVLDEYRIQSSIPTIRFLTERKAKVILASHLGRPKGVDLSLSLKPVAKVLSNLLGYDVIMLKDCIGEEVKEAVRLLKDGEVVLLENLRFHKGEEENDPEFAKALSELADVYVDDAFATAHREAASTVGITEFLPSVAGLLMEKEIKTLTKLLTAPERPFTAILGGAKVSDKIKLINNLMARVDNFLIGGGMCFTFLKALGYKIGYSLCEEDKIGLAEELLEKAKDKGIKFVLPADFVASSEIKDNAPYQVVDIEDFPNSMVGVDIGPKTVRMFQDEILKSKTIVWNGPLGVFEIERFAQGTLNIARFLGEHPEIMTVVGGGETAASFRKFGLGDKIAHISTGGGAFLEFLEGKTLPGVDAIHDR